MKEIKKLKRTENIDSDIVFCLERIIATIWQIHPFREGNTRACIVFVVLLAKHLGFAVNHESIGEYKVKDYVEHPHEYVK